MNTRADMHTHTYYSDGTQSPATLVAEATKYGVGILAVTDHDTMLACPSVHDLCLQKDIVPICGIEISAYAGDVKVHTLGYNVDYTSACYMAYFAKCVQGAEERTADILSKLKGYNIDIPLDMVKAELFDACQPIHVSHIVRAAVKRGYTQNPWAFYAKWIDRGMPCFSNAGRPTPYEAIEVIHACGGIASLAHPGRLSLNKEEQVALITSLKNAGIDGIEACYSTHTAKETAYYKEIAKQFGLLVTGGSDTHTVGGSRKVGTPDFHPNEELLAVLKIDTTH